MPNSLFITDRFGRRRQWLAQGRAATLQTVREMRAICRASLGYDGGILDEGMHEFANQILFAAGVGGHKSRKEIEVIFLYVRDRIIYRRDPAGGNESIADARTPIRLGFGDCDDLSVLLVTLLGFVGYRSRFVVARYNEETKDGFDHVYVEVSFKGKWIALDPTNPKAVVGWEEPRSLERRVYQIFSDKPGELEGFKSFFKKLGKGALKVAPLALNVIPGIGTAASAAIMAGVNAAEGAIGAAGGSSKNGKNTGTRERMIYLQTKSKTKKLDKQETGELAQLVPFWKAQDDAQAAAQAAAQKAADDAKAAEAEKLRRDDERQAALIAAISGKTPSGGFATPFGEVSPLMLAGGALALILILKR